MKRLVTIAAVVAAIMAANRLYAQGVNVHVLADRDDYSNWGYTDVWGYEAPDGREYALLGVNGGVSIVDVTDTSNIMEAEFVPWVSTGFTGWYDMKTYRHYMYVSSEASNNVLIVDLSGLPDSARVVGTTQNFQTDPHNIFIDTTQALLFVIEDFNSNHPVDILDLGNPESPTLVSVLGPGLGTDAHDVFSQDQVLYVAEGINGSIGIFDISDPSSPSLLRRLNIPSPGYVHNVWVSEDNTVMMTTEETTDHTVKLWDISDLGNITMLDEYLGPGRLAHNVMIRSPFAYLSHYESGLIVLDISDPVNILEVGSYDTYPSSNNPNYNGAWGVYPLGLNNKVFISDIETGLYVLQFTGAAAYRVEGTLTSSATGQGIEGGWIEVLETGLQVQTGTGGSFVIGSGLSQITLSAHAYGYGGQELFLNGSPGSTDTVQVALDDAQTGMLSGHVTNAFMTPLGGVGLQLAIGGRLFEEPITVSAVTDGNGDYLFGDLYVSDEDWLTYEEITVVENFPHAAVSRAAPLIVAGSPAVEDFSLVPADFLLVNDDPAGNYMTEFLDALSATGAVPYLWLTMSDGEAIPAGGVGQLSSPLVVWFTGDATGEVLTSSGRDSLEVVLEAGGKLFLAGRTVVGALSGSVFLSDYLQVSHGGTVTGTSFVSSVPGNPMSGGMSGFLTGGGSKDIVDPLVSGDALSAFTYTGGASAGVTVENPANASKVVVLGFGLENISAATSREAVATAAMNWLGVVTDVGPEPALLPDEYGLGQNFPNPFNPATSITFRLPAESSVSLTVYNLLGQEIARLLDDRTLPAGSYSAEWDGRDTGGRNAASGVYLYRLEATGATGKRFTEMKKMVLLR